MRRFSISKEEFAIRAGPEFDLSALHELARAEGATLRQLDVEHEAGSDRLLMIVTLPARYPPATFMRLVGELPGVRGAERDGQLPDAVPRGRRNRPPVLLSGAEASGRGACRSPW